MRVCGAFGGRGPHSHAGVFRSVLGMSWARAVRRSPYLRRVAWVYVLSAVLEIVGVMLTVYDLRASRTRTADLLERRGQSSYAQSPARMSEEFIAARISDTGGHWARRYAGPGIISAGIVVGMAANIAALPG